MTNLTLSVDSEIIKQAKLRAVQEGASLSDIVRGFLRRYSQGQDVVAAPDFSFAQNAMLFAKEKRHGAKAVQDIEPAPLAANGVSVDADYLRKIRGWAREDLYDRPTRHGSAAPKAAL